tara:strand:+ start:125 stop:463 length:339 start_codon:yes stop_codon:yes gene_type:complete
MKPTQEQILRALNKLIKESKTELKTEKVELSLINDFDSAWSAGFKFIQNANKELKEVGKTFTAGIREFENALDASSKFEKAAKELGVNVPKEIKSKTKEAKQYIKEAKDKIK